MDGHSFIAVHMRLLHNAARGMPADHSELHGQTAEHLVRGVSLNNNTMSFLTGADRGDPGHACTVKPS